MQLQATTINLTQLWLDTQPDMTAHKARQGVIKTHCDNTGQGCTGVRNMFMGQFLDWNIVNWRHKHTIDKLNQQQYYKAQKHKLFLLTILCVIKGKVRPRTGHEGPEGQ